MWTLKGISIKQFGSLVGKEYVKILTKNKKYGPELSAKEIGNPTIHEYNKNEI